MGKVQRVHYHMYRFSYVLSMFFSSTLAFSHSTIKFIPGFEGELPFELQTGYVGVDKSEDVQLFYYFVKSESDPKEDPLVLWLSGGPGCSSFNGFAFEIGPLRFDTENDAGSFPTLVLNPFSWTKVASIIFLDLPVGTGFSYARTSVASHSSDLQACNQAYEFLKKWLIDHPEYLSNQVYIAGDSYSGETVPIITQLVSNGIESFAEPHIHLKGYLLGNPVTIQPEENNYRIPFAHGMGLISDELYQSLQRNCRGEYFNIDPSNTLCLQDSEAFDECTSGLDSGNILSPSCVTFETFNKRRSTREKVIKLIDPKPSPCPDAVAAASDLQVIWLNYKSVQTALGVREGTVTTWRSCDRELPFTITITNSVPYHVNLSTKSYRSLIYSGDHDFIVPFVATQAWITSLNYSIVDDWRPWIVQDQVAGYTRSYANRMTFATVKGGGHTPSDFHPRECLSMIKRWLSHQPL